MPSREPKWTQEMRKLVYSRLVMEFGSYDTWQNTGYPAGKEERYNAVLKELASYLSAISGDLFAASAVKAQVQWGKTKQGSVLNAGFARNFILNKAAAIDAGFIKAKDLPSQMLSVHKE